MRDYNIHCKSVNAGVCFADGKMNEVKVNSIIHDSIMLKSFSKLLNI